jgi:hypothetical protein
VSEDRADLSGGSARRSRTAARLAAGAAALATLLGMLAGTAHAASGKNALDRAQSWVTTGVPYSMSGSYTNEYGAYRTDCSGFVSMAWGLGSSYTTVTLPSVSFPIPAEELQPGDIVLNTAPGASGHVVLFAGWADDARTRYYAYEQSPRSGASFTEIPYPYWPGHGEFAPYRYLGAVQPSGLPQVEVPDPVVPSPEPTPDPPADGDFVTYSGDVYRIAGGAPVYVSRWKRVGGKQPARALTDAEFAALEKTPADGTFLRTGPGEVYRVAGGAPVYVGGQWRQSLDPQPTVIDVDKFAVNNAGRGAQLNHLRETPTDGTFLRTAPGEVYRVAGGAPVYVAGDWWQGLDPKPEAVRVSPETIETAGEPASHLNHKPTDGTYLRTDDGAAYVIAGGAPIHVTDAWLKQQRPKPEPVKVSQEAVEQAGGLGAWAHLRNYPEDGTLLKAGAEVYRVVGGIPVRESGIRGLVIDPAAIENAGQPRPWSHLRAVSQTP